MVTNLKQYKNRLSFSLENLKLNEFGGEVYRNQPVGNQSKLSHLFSVGGVSAWLPHLNKSKF